MKQNFKISFAIIVISLFVLLANGVFATPSGGTVSDLGSSSAAGGTAGNSSAYAGNVSELTITGISTTQTWQGYYGNVSGAIRLADANNYVMYNWSLASPQGEIYASTNSSIQWVYVQCFNFSATGTYAADTANAGQTSKFGTNLTQLEATFGISAVDPDGVNETFTLSGGSGHGSFFTGSLQFSTGECRGTRVFDNSGTGVQNNFEEALLYEPQSTSVIFASLLDQDLAGFNGKTNDFEMLVLEDGHGTNVATTPYYFFVELQ